MMFTMGLPLSKVHEITTNQSIFIGHHCSFSEVEKLAVKVLLVCVDLIHRSVVTLAKVQEPAIELS